MKENLLNLSGKIDNLTIEIFECIAHVADSLNIPFFVVGAAARDIILQYGYGILTTRATADIDFGVQVSDWEHYKQLRDGLISTGKFTSDKKKAQRILFEKNFPVDIIPFGAIANLDNSVSWPPDHEVEMSTLGFEESYRHSLTVRLRSDPILDVQFSSLPGLALMKIISWHDRYPERKRDAKDIILLMRNYLDTGNEERLYNEEADLLEEEDFDYLRASARLLGRDIAAILNPKTAKTILEILDRETGKQDRYRLIEDMRDISGGFNNNFEENLQLLEELKSGILEKS
jgi:predicted nucleotidyltransferase